jgi:hypothetical protein
MVAVWAVVTTLLVAGIILASTGEIRALREITEHEFNADGQARNVAEAGLVDAYAWFRRQTSQPVATFTPRRDMAADPPVNETDDPSVGLVREFEVGGGLWARYEVRAGRPAESFTDANTNGLYDAGEVFVDANGDGRWNPAEGTRDVAAERGSDVPGAIWRIEALGQVFRRRRADQPLGTGLNGPIGQATLATEIRRMTTVPPAAAAICARSLSLVNIERRTRIHSKTAGVAGPAGTGSPTIEGGAEILAPSTSAALPSYADSVQSVFGMEWSELRTVADIAVDQDSGILPATLPPYTLTVVEADLEFDDGNPLRGTAVLVVKGSARLKRGSNSFFNGLLYVDGNLEIEAPCFLRGVVIVTGEVRLKGRGGDYVEIAYDPDVIGDLLARMGRYRVARGVYRPALHRHQGVPDERFQTRRRFGTATPGPAD